MSPSKRKRQSRLTFTPLPSSSPASRQYNSQIRERAAAVGYDGSPSPAKRQRRTMEYGGVNDDLPTPAATMDRPQNASSDAELGDESEDEEPVQSTQRRVTENSDRVVRKKRARQQQLDFSNARDSDSFDTLVTLSSPARAPASSRSMFSSQLRRVKRSARESSDESDQALELVEDVMPEKKAGKQRLLRSSQRPVIVESEEDEDDDVNVSSGRKRRAAVIDEEDEDNGEGAVEDVAQPSEDEEDMPTTAGKQKRTRRRRSNSFVVSSPPAMINSDDDLEIIEQPKRKRRKQAHGSDDGEGNHPKRKGLRRLTQQDQEDLDEDLEFLGPSSDVEALNAIPRNTQSKQKAARNAALERLKRKRSGQPQQVEAIEGDDEQADEDHLPEVVGDDDSVEEIAVPSHQERRNNMRKMFQTDEYDEEFIEDEDENGEDPLGVPDGIPIQFTKYARMKAKELFKFAVEWMVQKKINPAFQMTDEIYDLSFKKLDDEVKGLAGSKFTSAAWTQRFTMSLKSRPDIAYSHLDRGGGHFDALDKCDACNRTGHPATYELQFTGKPYHPTALEAVGADDEDSDGDEESSDDEDADNQPSWDYQGREVPPASTIYHVGKFCMANAETAHALSHWRYHLNEWVVDWLRKQGYLTDQKIVKRDKMSTKRRRKEANKVADRMEHEGVTKQLWKDFRFNIDQARESKQGRFDAGSP